MSTSAGSPTITRPPTQQSVTLSRCPIDCSVTLTLVPENLDQSKVTGIDQVDKLQDGVNNLAAGQLGQGGLAQPIGDFASKEGATRSERGGKADDGSYMPGQESMSNAASGLADGGKSVGSGVTSGVQGVGGALGLGGGGNKEEESKK